MLTESALAQEVGPEDVRVPLQSLIQKQQQYETGLLEVQQELFTATRAIKDGPAKERLVSLLAEIDLELREIRGKINLNCHRVEQGRLRSV
jgi:hypothetical protein